MKSVDTNIIVRLLVGDDAAQNKAVIELLARAERLQQPLRVLTIVVFETIWVLDRRYERTRKEIIDGLDNLSNLRALHFEHPQVIRDFIQMARSTTTGLADLIIGIYSLADGCENVLTLDHKAARSDLFEKLKA